jgi:hypothetical protein
MVTTVPVSHRASLACDNVDCGLMEHEGACEFGIRVVNKKTWNGDGTYVGRPSALGNPYVIGKHGDRDQVIDRYRRWLFRGICRRDPEVIAALLQLGDGSVLICWCAPEPCHAQVIVRAWRWAQREGLL